MADPIVNDDDEDDEPGQTPVPEPVHKEGGPLTAEDAECFTEHEVG